MFYQPTADGAKANCEAKGEKLAAFYTEDSVAWIRDQWSAIGLDCKTKRHKLVLDW